VRISLPRQHFSIDPGHEFVADALDQTVTDELGVYFRSKEHGIYLNACALAPGGHPLTTDGLFALLREQGWASAPFDEWSDTAELVSIVGGTFETVGMGGEVVLEIFVTDGRSVANLAGPGKREIIAAVTPAARRLASTLRFE